MHFFTVLMNRKNQEHGYMVDACAESITLRSLVCDSIGRFGIASTIERRSKSSESVHKMTQMGLHTYDQDAKPEVGVVR